MKPEVVDLTLRLYLSESHFCFYLRNKNRKRKVIIIKYKHKLIRPSSLASPDNVKGLNREVMLSPIKLTAFVASEATTGTIIKDKIRATIKMTIRHARFMFMAPPFWQIRIWVHLLECVFTFFCA